MRRKSKARREHKLIGFKAYRDTDADLLAWWESIRAGERSDILRHLVRAALGYESLRPRPTNQLETIQNELVWMRNALSELPAYVEHVMHQVAAVTPRSRAHTGNGKRSPLTMSDESVRRREQRMKKAKW